jgi:hypothetical protein
MPRLWVRDLDSLTSRPLSAADVASKPFWSPDSLTIAFFDAGHLKKVDLAGGPAVTLCDTPFVASGTWNQKGVIVFELKPLSAAAYFAYPSRAELRSH